MMIIYPPPHLSRSVHLRYGRTPVGVAHHAAHHGHLGDVAVVFDAGQDLEPGLGGKIPCPDANIAVLGEGLVYAHTQERSGCT